MRTGYRRLHGVRAAVCLLHAAWQLETHAASGQPLELVGSEAELGVVVYPARNPGRQRVTVVLHGMCGEPRNTCRAFETEVTRTDHLVCPRANRPCRDGGASWAQVGFQEPLERAVERAEAALGELVQLEGGRTLIGYSLGAYRALELAQHGASKYPRVMLIGAKVQVSPRRLRDNGVERLLLSAGAWDMTYDPMRREAQRLTRSGVRTRFLGLGPVGHAFAPSFADHLRKALDWLQTDPSVS